VVTTRNRRQLTKKQHPEAVVTSGYCRSACSEFLIEFSVGILSAKADGRWILGDDHPELLTPESFLEYYLGSLNNLAELIIPT
jgi:hypothetical protein